MPSDVLCMALGNAPTGEQLSRFLAVGLADNTVRIISLDPTVSLVAQQYRAAMHSNNAASYFYLSE